MYNIFPPCSRTDRSEYYGKRRALSSQTFVNVQRYASRFTERSEPRRSTVPSRRHRGKHDLLADAGRDVRHIRRTAGLVQISGHKRRIEGKYYTTMSGDGN